MIVRKPQLPCMLWHTDGVQLIHQNGSLTILGTSPGQTASMHIKAADLRKLAKHLQILADQLTQSTK